jgi:hypothetical protein
LQPHAFLFSQLSALFSSQSTAAAQDERIARELLARDELTARQMMAGDELMARQLALSMGLESDSEENDEDSDAEQDTSAAESEDEDGSQARTTGSASDAAVGQAHPGKAVIFPPGENAQAQSDTLVVPSFSTLYRFAVSCLDDRIHSPGTSTVAIQERYLEWFQRQPRILAEARMRRGLPLGGAIQEWADRAKSAVSFDEFLYIVRLFYAVVVRGAPKVAREVLLDAPWSDAFPMYQLSRRFQRDPPAGQEALATALYDNLQTISRKQAFLLEQRSAGEGSAAAAAAGSQARTMGSANSAVDGAHIARALTGLRARADALRRRAEDLTTKLEKQLLA